MRRGEKEAISDHNNSLKQYLDLFVFVFILLPQVYLNIYIYTHVHKRIL